jgi:hypothetical protein
MTFKHGRRHWIGNKQVNRKNHKRHLILGIETSCDETAAAVVENGVTILSNVIASQIDLHAEYGGVVPEIASREHVKSILPVIDYALSDANVGLDDLTAIAGELYTLDSTTATAGELYTADSTTATAGELYTPDSTTATAGELYTATGGVCSDAATTRWRTIRTVPISRLSSCSSASTTHHADVCAASTLCAASAATCLDRWTASSSACSQT